jgi:hypothetical protein
VDDPCLAHWGRCTCVVVGSSRRAVRVAVEGQELVAGPVEASIDFAHFCFFEVV